MLLLIDNYDSFSHNLAHLLTQSCSEEVRVVRSDALTVDELFGLNPKACVLSPGPGRPEDRGIGLDLVPRAIASGLPLLGVCLGHQTIGAALGGRVVRAPSPIHGKVSPITHDGSSVFEELPETFPVMRYHSLVLEESSLPPELRVTARLQDASNLVMALQHRTAPVYGIQFHPESFMTPLGTRIMENFLRAVGVR